MIYLVIPSYTKNSASSNRFLAIAKGLTELGISHVNVAINPSSNFDKEANVSLYGKFIYLWNGKKTRIGLINNAMSFLNSKLWHWRFKSFLHSLTSADIVVSISAAFALPDIVAIHKGKKYFERAEHILASKQGFDTKELQDFYYDCCKKLDGLFVISSSLKQSFVDNGVNPDKIRVLNMIVDTDRFYGLVKEEVPDPYIAYCGTVSTFKDGVDDLIKSFSIVSSINRDIKLYIVGPIPKAGDRNICAQLVKEYHLEDRVVFTGAIPANQMPQMLKNAEALVLARPNNLQAQNGFPTKLGEYLLSENPVIITKTGDIPLFLTDNKDALLVNPGNCDEIADKILWTLSHKEESKIIGWNGAQVARKHFNYLIETKKLVEIIRSDCRL